MLGKTLWAALLLTVACGARAEALSDAELDAISGQEGIALGLNLYFNSVRAPATPATDGTPYASLSSCAGVGNPCHVAVQLANRTDASGEWLVFKDFYFSLKVPLLRLDVAPALSAAGSNTAYFDVTRFQGDGGTCLLGTGNCTTSYINTLPALKLTVPATTTSYNPATGLSTGYNSVELALNIGRMATEFGATGYNADVNGSFMGVRVDDNNPNSNYAGAAITGTAYLFGF
ncbi:MAG: hypothetical protein K0R03_191 [Moraxellaceae bacterium]|jgi:hypothetical protein|nr:hypothetical protein [Moraxellaceae bacterium]